MLGLRGIDDGLKEKAIIFSTSSCIRRVAIGKAECRAKVRLSPSNRSLSCNDGMPNPCPHFSSISLIEVVTGNAMMRYLVPHKGCDKVDEGAVVSMTTTASSYKVARCRALPEG